MPLSMTPTVDPELSPRISVIGVGGAGGNAVNNMIEAELEGVEFVCANTDAQAVNLSRAAHKIQLGTGVTSGLGAGSRPQIGEAAAEESIEEVMSLIEGSNMLFITAGMGGGTGTGAAPVIAKAARELGILTVGVVTKPFHFEGARRMRIAEEGIEELQRHVDTLLIIPNQNLFRLADENTTFQDAFAMADEVLHAGVRGITDLMIVPGLITLDFADVRAVMSEMGKAMMGTGEAAGEERAAAAAAAAISNPLLDETSMKGAKGVLINITGGLDMKLFEVDEAANRIRSEVDPEANIIVGSTFSQDLQGTMRVSVVATGIERAADETPAPRAVARPAPAPKPVVIAETAEAEAEEVAPAAEAAAPAPIPAPIPAPKPAATVAPAAAAAPAAPEAPANPVGDVHERIRRMLTEDQPTPIAPGLAPQAPRPNPFRGRAPASPIQDAVGVLRGALGSLAGTAAATPAPKRPRADDFGDTPEDLEIPAFLRRHN